MATPLVLRRVITFAKALRPRNLTFDGKNLTLDGKNLILRTR